MDSIGLPCASLPLTSTCFCTAILHSSKKGSRSCRSPNQSLFLQPPACNSAGSAREDVAKVFPSLPRQKEEIIIAQAGHMVGIVSDAVDGSFSRITPNGCSHSLPLVMPGRPFHIPGTKDSKDGQPACRFSPRSSFSIEGDRCRCRHFSLQPSGNELLFPFRPLEIPSPDFGGISASQSHGRTLFLRSPAHDRSESVSNPHPRCISSGSQAGPHS